MSSRILRPDDPRSAGAVGWRDVAGRVREPHAADADRQPPPGERVAEAERECERRMQEAHAAGLAEGEAAGRVRAAAEVQPVLERLARTLEELGQWRARLRREAESDMLRLSLAIARRVLLRELAIDPDAMHGLVLGALEKLRSQEISRVRVHPSHAAQLKNWLRAGAGGSGIEVIADQARQPGDVIFETECGSLDASVNSQLQEIERGLTDRLQQSR